MTVEVSGIETTGPQSTAFLITEGDSQRLSLSLPAGVSYDTYRAMRKHPTIALARALTVAPIVAGQWSTKAMPGASNDAVELIEINLFPLRSQIMEQALLSGIDFGWQAWEKVFILKDNRIRLKKLKPLLPDITDILVVPATGAFAGFIQRFNTKLELSQSLLIPWRAEGTNWYGEPLLENTRVPYNSWFEVDSGAARYDKKVAGAHFLVRYPPGSTIVEGIEKDNFMIAKDLLGALESSGSVTIPALPIKYVERLNEQTGSSWQIELLSDKSPKQPSFINRLEYLDKLIVRSLLWPERALLEGKFGTKAEASIHAGAAITNMELMDEFVTRHINWHLVDQLLALNFGEKARGTVQLQSSPILDEKQQFLREIFLAVFKDPVGFAEMVEHLDFEALFDRLGIPALSTTETGSVVDEFREAFKIALRELATPVKESV